MTWTALGSTRSMSTEHVWRTWAQTQQLDVEVTGDVSARARKTRCAHRAYAGSARRAPDARLPARIATIRTSSKTATAEPSRRSRQRTRARNQHALPLDPLIL